MFVVIYIYKEECMYVCMFAMHSVPVKASVTKLSMGPPQAQRMVIGGSPPPRGWVGVGCGCGCGWEISPRL